MDILNDSHNPMYDDPLANINMDSLQGIPVSVFDIYTEERQSFQTIQEAADLCMYPIELSH